MLKMILGFLISVKGIYLLAGILFIVFLIRVLRIISNRKSRVKEFRQAAEDRARDESLNNVILNPRSDNTNKEAYVPYEVDYSASAQNGTVNTTSQVSTEIMMVQIIEQTELSKRKFVLNASKGIKIGSTSENDISFFSDSGTDFQCEVFSVNSHVFARNLNSDARIILRRKKDSAVLDTKGIRIKSGDTIIMDKNSYIISLM